MYPSLQGPVDAVRLKVTNDEILILSELNLKWINSGSILRMYD